MNALTFSIASSVSDISLMASSLYSLKNVHALDAMKIFFIIPLRRNSGLIDYSMKGEAISYL
ncbi:MAG: hypothetical protein M1462_00345 [Candidatus Thermoplasmatota archaeon]|uniref:hypothetical protein n=1 Tax=Ferroplasma sp. TaxID=2591003 RepID=UPI002632CB4A|nr:hypothetical protein [Ferroplasma sp.]MCL4310867.1 hypothetical protein [Candidatus Thermoplasmatota archaeon]